MSEGRGYEFLGGAIQPLQSEPQQFSGQSEGDFIPAAVPKAKAQPHQTPIAEAPDPAPPPTRPVAKAPALTPKKLVSQARARIREIRRELKRAKRLERELTELQRLVAAADGKTIAPVRALDTARSKSAG